MNNSQRHELECLVSSLCDGVLDAEGRAQLEAMLRESGDARQHYLEYMDMHARLSVHPNLATGIPLGTEAVTTAADDAPVLELARQSFEQLEEHTRSKRYRRRMVSLRSYVTLALVVLLSVFVWQMYEARQLESRQPVVQALSGESTMERSGQTFATQVGHRLRPGERLSTNGEDARAVLAYDDGTRVVVSSDSTVEVPARTRGGELRLVSGTMDVEAAPQQPGKPLIFSTDHARYVVLGTHFRLYRDEKASRLELDEGKVRLERESRSEAVEVTAGHVAVATADNEPVEIQPLAKGQATLVATHRRGGGGVAFSTDGQRLATSEWNRGFQILQPTNSEPLQSVADQVGRSDGLVLQDRALVQIADGHPESLVKLWRLDEEKSRKIKLSGLASRSRTMSPSGTHVAEATREGIFVYEIEVLKAKAKRVATLPSAGKPWCLALTPDVKFAASGIWNGTVRVYRLPELNRSQPAPFVDDVVFETKLVHTPTQLALSDAADRLAVFSRKDGLLIFDLASGEQRVLWPAGTVHVSCLKFTPDGGWLIAGLSDGTARIWSVADGRALLVVDAGQRPRDVAWSPRTSLLATAGGDVKVWQCEIP